MDNISESVSDGESSNGSTGDGRGEAGDDGAASDSAGCSAPDSTGAPAQHLAVLAGRSAGGFGLEFNPVTTGLLLGADLEGGIQLWDVEHMQDTKCSQRGSTHASCSSSPRQRLSPVQVGCVVPNSRRSCCDLC